MWRELLMAAIAASSKTKVAKDLGVSRPTISQIANGRYGASPEHVGKKIMEVYGRIPCPHLSVEISQAKCREYHSSQPPTSSPRAMKHWRACQNCMQKIVTVDQNIGSKP